MQRRNDVNSSSSFVIKQWSLVATSQCLVVAGVVQRRLAIGHSFVLGHSSLTRVIGEGPCGGIGSKCKAITRVNCEWGWNR